jgi:hypothetical protein
MLCSVYGFLMTAPTAGLDPDRAAAITALRTAVGGRMFPNILDEGCALPALTYQRIGETTEENLDGAPDGLYDIHIQIDVWAMTRSQCDSLALSLRDSLVGYTNASMGTNVWVNALWRDDAVDDYEEARKQYRTISDFHVIYNESDS